VAKFVTKQVRRSGVPLPCLKWPSTPPDPLWGEFGPPHFSPLLPASANSLSVNCDAFVWGNQCSSYIEIM
jgi:hypothetical protein